MSGQKIAIIIGAGPAGLTAALELLRHSNIKPIILELTDTVGGISKTVNYKGNRIDIGGHRFFSKSDVIMNWWQEIMPIETISDKEITISYQNKNKTIIPKSNVTNTDDVLLIRKRVSRIFFLQKLFDYPLNLNFKTLKKLGFILSLKIAYSYGLSLLFPIKKELSLEDFLINRFGKKLYSVFFKDYTEKVWGVSCTEIPSEWGKQRIKKLNILKALKHVLSKNKKDTSIEQKNTETSLIEQFLYPKYGPGQLWENVAKTIIEKGGEIHFNFKVLTINHSDFYTNSIIGLKGDNEKTIKADYVISTMPVKYLIRGLGKDVPENIQQTAKDLVYRDFITVGLLVDKIKISNGRIKDNWIYIQDNSVKLGRLQIFNNWSPYMVKDDSKIWLGLEYFCNQNDEIWSMSKTAFIEFATNELISIGIIDRKDVLDYTVIKMPKAYPAYFGSYNKFEEIIEYTNRFKNLFLIGRNGMHKYNNQDHSMLTAITAIENIINERIDKSNIWNINTEEEYHEKK